MRALRVEAGDALTPTGTQARRLCAADARSLCSVLHLSQFFDVVSRSSQSNCASLQPVLCVAPSSDSLLLYLPTGKHSLAVCFSRALQRHHTIVIPDVEMAELLEACHPSA